MELQDIRTAAIARAGLDPNDARIPTSVVTAFVNGALRQVAMLADWDWLYLNETIASVPGQAAYARNAQARKTDRVIDVTDKTLLQQIDKKQAVRYLSYTDALPRFWYVEYGQLYLVPTPTTVRSYQHHYVAAEPTLAVDDAEPYIPDWAMDIVIIKAATMLAARLDNTSLLQLLEREEKKLIDGLMDESRRSRGSQIPQSRRDWAT